MHSHLWIACAVSALALEYFLLEKIAFQYTYVWILGAGTCLFYSLHRLMQIRIYKKVESPRIQELQSHRKLYVLASFISLLILTILLPQLGIKKAAWFVLLSIPFTLYLLPLFKNQKRLRDLPYVKIFIIALGWTILTLIVPNILYTEMPISRLIAISVEHFAYIFLLTLPFDIRDIKDDQALGLKTLITLKNVQSGKRISTVISIFYLLFITALFASQTISWEAYIAYLFAMICIMAGTKKAHPERSNAYYSFYLDAIPILRFLLFYGLMQIQT